MEKTLEEDLRKNIELLEDFGELKGNVLGS